MEYIHATVTKGWYKEKTTDERIIPAGFKWVENNVVTSSGLYDGFVNYWTVVYDYDEDMYDDLVSASIIDLYNLTSDIAVLTIRDVAPIPELEKQTPEEAFADPRLSSMVFIELSENFNLTEIRRLDGPQEELTEATVQILSLRSSLDDNREAVDAVVMAGMNFLSGRFRAGHGIGIYMNGPRADALWNQVLAEVYDKFTLKNSDVVPDIKFKLSSDIKDTDDMNEMIRKAAVIREQFR